MLSHVIFKSEYTLRQVYDALLNSGFKRCEKNWASFGVFIYEPDGGNLTYSSTEGSLTYSSTEGSLEVRILMAVPRGNRNLVVELYISNYSRKYVEGLECFDKYGEGEDI